MWLWVLLFENSQKVKLGGISHGDRDKVRRQNAAMLHCKS